MTRRSTISFGTCQLNIAEREVRSQGQLQTVAHTTFDLLVSLLSRHDEVVSKSELCRLVWGHKPVSSNLLARTVMHARQAIGDDAANPVWIKTVHGVGYRFVGAVVVDAATAAVKATALPAPSPDRLSESLATAGTLTGALTGTLRIALLPIENCTGDPQLVWVELGLAALIVQTLPGDVLISLPLLDIVKSLNDLPPGSSVPERAAALHSTRGVTCVVHASLHRTADGFRLDYRVYGAPHQSMEGSLHDIEAVQLGQRLAQQLVQRLVASGDPLVRFESNDPLFNQLVARGMQAHSIRQSRDAIRFLQSALLLEPLNVGARLWLLKSMIQCGHRDVTALGQELLDEARERGDERLQGMVHEALMALSLLYGIEAARLHVQSALTFAARYEHEDWALRARSRAGVDAVQRHDVAEGLMHYEWVRQHCLDAGDWQNWTTSTINLADLHIDICDLPTAQALLEQALAVAQRHGWSWMQLIANGKLSVIWAKLGRLTAGAQLCEQIAASGTPLQDELCTGVTFESGFFVYGQTRAVSDIGRLLRRWPHLRRQGQPIPRLYACLLLAERAALSGRAGAARRILHEAIGLAHDMHYAMALHPPLIRLLLLELRAGAFAEARRLCTEIEALPSFGNSADLRVWILHAQAAELHAAGRHEAALERLLTAARSSPVGKAQAYVSLACAWLSLEQDRLALAVYLIQPIGPWLEEHAFGLTVMARLRFEQGDTPRAIALQRQALSQWPHHRDAAALRPLLAAYESTLGNGDTTTVTAVSLLPTLLTLV